MQTPLQQFGVSPVHAVPQAPQLVALMLRSVQVPLQHAGVVPVQAGPVQEPQWVTLEVTSVQTPEQQVDVVPVHWMILPRQHIIYKKLGRR